MNDREYITRIESELAEALDRAERAERAFKSAQISLAEQREQLIEAQRRVEMMRQIACEIAKRTNQQQRIAAGEKE